MRWTAQIYPLLKVAGTAAGSVTLLVRFALGVSPPERPSLAPELLAAPTGNGPVGAPVAEQPQISAATSAAIENLREELSREPLSSRTTVGDFVRRAHAQDDFVRELGRAELLGGPRWLDAQTCQVQLEISGARLARALQQIAATHKDAPLSPKEIDRVTLDWHRRTFAATGSSTVFAHVTAARPRASTGPWADVSDAARGRALEAAREDAVARVLSSIRRVSVGRTATIGDWLGVKEIRNELTDWLTDRPVTRVNYRADLQVELTLSATPDRLFALLRRDVERHPEIGPPTTDADWARIRLDLVDRMQPAIGRGLAAADLPPPGVALVNPNPGKEVAPGTPRTVPAGHAPVDRVRLPGSPPSWVSDHVSAAAAVDAGSSKLKAARQAAAAARVKLTEQIDALPLGPGLTVAAAAEKDAHVRDAIGRAVDHARVEKTDYYHDGDVQVELRLELSEVWDQLKLMP